MQQQKSYVKWAFLLLFWKKEMKLNLKNPLVIFDLETTGTNIVTDRIVEISYLKVYPNGREESKTILINPEIPIPEFVSAIHGIYDKDVGSGSPHHTPKFDIAENGLVTGVAAALSYVTAVLKEKPACPSFHAVDLESMLKLTE